MLRLNALCSFGVQMHVYQRSVQKLRNVSKSQTAGKTWGEGARFPLGGKLTASYGAGGDA